jgi:hypothetical protein
MSLLVIDSYARVHHNIVRFLEKLTDEQIRAQVTPHSHSIAFHGWHVARWADHFQAAVSGMTPELGQRLGEGVQIWYADDVGAKWGFDNAVLGFDATGMNMADEVAVRLVFPSKSVLLDYVGRVVERAERVVRAIDETEFEREEQPQPLTEKIFGGGTVGAAVMSHVTHANRHLGMMEALLGVQSGRGSATV